MPTLSDSRLTLTATSSREVAVNVRYSATFSPVEKHLASYGLVFQEVKSKQEDICNKTAARAVLVAGGEKSAD